MSRKKVFLRTAGLICLVLMSGNLAASGRQQTVETVDLIAGSGKQTTRQAETDGIQNSVYLSERKTKDSATKKVLPKPVSIRGKHQVKIRVTINQQGNVDDAEIVSGKPLLAAAAVQASREWKFKFSKTNKNPVQYVGTITYIFTNNKVEIL